MKLKKVGLVTIGPLLERQLSLKIVTQKEPVVMTFGFEWEGVGALEYLNKELATLQWARDVLDKQIGILEARKKAAA